VSLLEPKDFQAMRRMLSAAGAAEQALRDSEARLRAVLDGADDGLVLLASVRDQHGKIADFKYVYCNRASTEIAGYDRTGKFLLQCHPALKPVGIFDLYVEAVETNKPLAMELGYRHLGIDKTFRIRATPFNQGLVIWYSDISELAALRAKAAAHVAT